MAVLYSETQIPAKGKVDGQGGETFKVKLKLPQKQMVTIFLPWRANAPSKFPDTSELAAN